ncbi:DUF948 domain-containing protein [Lentibacillus sediminis]|uniref:DUF948 domain-containing protein n=1 Tax=Lentibacillus sediminis TaxID=1940529 RepID=UPI000C1BD8E5|nr:DUF948 domain-containing protein [Lentibacillus sediminis]
MDWLGIGVIVIGVAFLGLVVLLVKPLNNLAGVLSNLQKTTDDLPQQVTDITTQTKDVMNTSKDTLNSLNNQVKELSPLFYIVGDAGRAANHVSASMADAVTKMETRTQNASDLTHRKNLEGVYGALTLGYFLYQKRNKMTK